jgi:hypothetical protein
MCGGNSMLDKQSTLTVIIAVDHYNQPPLHAPLSSFPTPENLEKLSVSHLITDILVILTIFAVT